MDCVAECAVYDGYIVLRVICLSGERKSPTEHTLAHTNTRWEDAEDNAANHLAISQFAKRHFSIAQEREDVSARDISDDCLRPFDKVVDERLHVNAEQSPHLIKTRRVIGHKRILIHCGKLHPSGRKCVPTTIVRNDVARNSGCGNVLVPRKQ